MNSCWLLKPTSHGAEVGYYTPKARTAGFSVVVESEWVTVFVFTDVAGKPKDAILAAERKVNYLNGGSGL